MEERDGGGRENWRERGDEKGGKRETKGEKGRERGEEGMEEEINRQTDGQRLVRSGRIKCERVMHLFLSLYANFMLLL